MVRAKGYSWTDECFHIANSNQKQLLQFYYVYYAKTNNDGWCFFLFFLFCFLQDSWKLILPSVFINAGITNLTTPNNSKFNRLETLQSVDYKDQMVVNIKIFLPLSTSLLFRLSHFPSYPSSSVSYSLSTNFNDLSFSLIAPCPLVSTSHSQRIWRVQAQGCPFCHWQRWPPRLPPPAQGQLFTARELHLCPWWISPTTSH